MENPSWHEPEHNAGDEVLRESRRRLLGKAQDAFEMASVLTEMSEGVYVSREPLAVDGHEDAVSIMLTRDGERPFVDDEGKEYIKLFFMQADFRNEDTPSLSIEDDLVWIEEYREKTRRRYLLTEHAFDPYVEEVDKSRIPHSVETGSEAGQLRRFRERLERFRLTPYK